MTRSSRSLATTSSSVGCRWDVCTVPKREPRYRAAASTPNWVQASAIVGRSPRILATTCGINYTAGTMMHFLRPNVSMVKR